MSEDIRWIRCFDNYTKALQILADAVRLSGERKLSDLEEQRVIQTFEFTHELAWNVLKDYLEYQGIRDIIGSRGAGREAFRNGLLDDGETWMAMIQDRNLSSHTYDQHPLHQLPVSNRLPVVERRRRFDGPSTGPSNSSHKNQQHRA